MSTSCDVASCNVDFSYMFVSANCDVAYLWSCGVEDVSHNSTSGDAASHGVEKQSLNNLRSVTNNNCILASLLRLTVL